MSLQRISRPVLPRCRVRSEPPVQSRSLFGFGWLRKVAQVEPTPPADHEQPEQPLHTPAVLSTTSNDAIKPISAQQAPRTPSTSAAAREKKEAKLLEREEAAIRALLDRDGGSAGFEYEDGRPAGGQSKAVQREMFRIMPAAKKASRSPKYS